MTNNAEDPPSQLEDRHLLIRVYGDSLSLPRSFDGVGFRDTYSEIVAHKCKQLWVGSRISLYNRSLSDRTIHELYSHYQTDSKYFGERGRQILIIQCGVCDCSPRPLPAVLRWFVGKMPGFLRGRVISFLHNRRALLLKAGFAWRRVSPHEFSKAYKEWISSAVRSFERVYVINIAPTNDDMEAHSPGFSASIKLYNSLIQQCTEAVAAKNLFCLDVYREITSAPSGVEQCINRKDGHHITVPGHRLYAEMLLKQEEKFAGSTMLIPDA